MGKAQVTQQVFIYILAILIVGLIFLFGYDAVSKLRKQADIISSTDLKSRITEEIADGRSYRTISKLEINIGAFDRICLVDLNKDPDGGLCNDIHIDYNREACDAWGSRTKSRANIFLIGINKFETIYGGDEEELEPYIEIDYPGYICLKGDRVTIGLNGTGDSVLAYKWQ